MKQFAGFILKVKKMITIKIKIGSLSKKSANLRNKFNLLSKLA